MCIRMDSRLLTVAGWGWRWVAQNWSLSRSLLFLSQKSSAVTLNSVQSSISLYRVTLYIVTSLFLSTLWNHKMFAKALQAEDKSFIILLWMIKWKKTFPSPIHYRGVSGLCFWDLLKNFKFKKFIFRLFLYYSTHPPPPPPPPPLSLSLSLSLSLHPFFFPPLKKMYQNGG